MARVLSILSRDYSKLADNGRKAIVSRMMAQIERKHEVETFVPQMANDFGKRVLLTSIIKNVVFGKAALQESLYDVAPNVLALAEQIKRFRPQVLHIDTGRLALMVERAIRHSGIDRSGLQIIVDMDDLMSRRYRVYRRMGLGLVLGVLGDRLKTYTRFAGTRISDAVLKMEARRMKVRELEIVNFADDVLFSSDFERRLIARVAPRCRARLHRHRIGYQIAPVTPDLDSTRLVFAFIGGDKLSQNRLSIEWLVRTWKTHSIPHRLLFIGRCERVYEACDSVEFLGFVDDLAQWYKHFDALVIFSFVRGGLKTKVPEALSMGVPVVVNAVAAEGVVGLEDYSLRFDETSVVNFFLSDPDYIRKRLGEARARSLPIAQKYWSEKALSEAMGELLSSHDQY